MSVYGPNIMLLLLRSFAAPARLRKEKENGAAPKQTILPSPPPSPSPVGGPYPPATAANAPGAQRGGTCLTLLLKRLWS